jgi:DHA2 family methylenomycin A resistance protein-like MFS transporter
VASGVLNAARQSGGALGVALLGSLFASSALAGSGSAAPSLRVPLAFAAVLNLAALLLARLTIRAGP